MLRPYKNTTFPKEATRLDFLTQATKTVVEAGRIGTPVFMRCVAQVAPDAAALSDALDNALQAAQTLLNAEPLNVYKLGSSEAGQITAAVKYAAGQTALVSVGIAHDEPRVDLMLLGNKGAIYHEGFRVQGSGFTANDSTPLPHPSAPFGVLLLAGNRTHQESYGRAFAADPRCRVVAVADERDVPPERAALNQQLAEELGIPYVPDLDAALARDDVHIVSVCVEHERRGRVAVKCAQAGKHLYLDKPMTCSVADADGVVAAVNATGVKSQVFSFTHAAWVQAAKRAVESGGVGDLIAVHADVLFAKGYAGSATLGTPRAQDPYPKRFTFADSKRELRATGVYALGVVRYLTGREVKIVYGATANYFFAEHQRNDVEDFGLLVLTLDGGLTATISAGRIGYMSHPQGGPNRAVLVGTKGVLVFDAYHPRLEVYTNEPAWTPPPVHPADPMSFWRSTQIETNTQPKRGWIATHPNAPSDESCFVDCLVAGRESAMSAQDGAAVVEALMAGYISAARGIEVTLPLPRE
jgi:predicted dehydrogenase